MVRNNEKMKGFLGYRQYVVAGLLIALAAVGTTALYSSRQEKEREQMEAELAEEMQKQADVLRRGEFGAVCRGICTGSSKTVFK